LTAITELDLKCRAVPRLLRHKKVEDHQGIRELGLSAGNALIRPLKFIKVIFSFLEPFLRCLV